MRNYVPVFVSVAILVLLALLLSVSSHVVDWVVADGFIYVVLAVFGLTVVLGATFSQSRMAFISVVYAAALLVIQYHCFVREDVARGSSSLLLASINLPLLTVIFYHQQECALISRQGLVIAAVSLFSALAILLVPELQSFRLAASGSGARVIEPLSEWIAVPSIGVLMFVVAAPFLLLKKEHDGPAVGMMFGLALLFVFIALNFQSSAFRGEEQHAVLRGFMLGGALVLVVAVLDTSWRHANIDELTGLSGRRQLYRHLGQVGGKYHIAIIDIDHFKKINDKYGHGTGDQVLRYVGAQLRAEKIGKAYRVGGEEFIIVLEGMERADAEAALNELRENILDRPFGIRARDRKRKKPDKAPDASRKAGDQVRISVSIGMAAPNERHRASSEVVAAADKALYTAKKAGRNRVKVAR